MYSWTPIFLVHADETFCISPSISLFFFFIQPLVFTLLSLYLSLSPHSLFVFSLVCPLPLLSNLSFPSAFSLSVVHLCLPPLHPLSPVMLPFAVSYSSSSSPLFWTSIAIRSALLLPLLLCQPSSSMSSPFLSASFPSDLPSSVVDLASSCCVCPYTTLRLSLFSGVALNIVGRRPDLNSFFLFIFFF